MKKMRWNIINVIDLLVDGGGGNTNINFKITVQFIRLFTVERGYQRVRNANMTRKRSSTNY